MSQTVPVLYANIGAEDLRSAKELHRALVQSIGLLREEQRPMVQIAVSVEIMTNRTIDQKSAQMQEYVTTFLQAFEIENERFTVKAQPACDGVVKIQLWRE